MKIAVISDTHNLLRPEVLEILEGCEAVFHAGDICKPEIFDCLEKLGKSFYIVRGNNDGVWAKKREIPDCLKITIEGIRIFMVHDRKNIPEELPYDLVIFGHSHKYEETKKGQILFLNPGSCGPSRFRLPVTMAVIHIFEKGTYQIEKIDFSGENSPDREREREISPGEMKTLVERVVKDIKRNKSVEQIAKKHRISRELAGQICRMYLTHPGVTADGIMQRLGY